MNAALRLSLFITLFFISLFSEAQIKISGVIIDNYKRPVSFASISADGNVGTVSNMDGKFELQLDKPDSVVVYFLGFESYSFYADKTKSVKVTLKPKSFLLEEVVVFPGINPADTIMLKVIAMRDVHNPQNLPSYRYTSYNKFTIEVNRDTLKYYANRANVSPQVNALIKFSEKSKLFVSEAITEKFYKKPGKMKEHVLTTNISGFRDPAFAVLGGQMHSFSCYDDFFSIFNLKYVNPVSKNAERKYLFLLKDTLRNTETGDVFIITFRPKPGTTFSGMYGMLYIDAQDYAVKKIVAQPATQPSQLGVVVKQEYQKLLDEYWFPNRYESILFFNTKIHKDLDHLPIVVGLAKTDIVNPEIGVEIPKQILRNQFQLSYSNDAATPNDSLLAQFRTDTLNIRDLKAFQFMDSAMSNPAMRFLTNLPKILINGELPISIFKINLHEVLGFNYQERWRYGISLMTNDRVFNWASLGGKVINSTEEDTLWYAARLHLNPLKSGILRLKYQYQSETTEKGEFHVYNPYRKGFYNLRKFVFRELNYIDGHDVALELEYPKNINLRVMGFMQDYTLSSTAQDTLYGDFSRTALRVDLRYAPGERLTNMGKYRIRAGSGGPVLNVAYEQGFSNQKTDVSYKKIFGEVTYNYSTRFMGTYRFMGRAGHMEGDVPLELLFNSKGAGRMPIYEPGIFYTMPVHRYFNTGFVQGFVQQYWPFYLNSQNLMISISTQLNVMYGELRNNRLLEIVKPTSKGFCEAGILGGFADPDYGQISIGTFYNFGAYSRSEQINNFAFVIGFTTYIDW
jgi:hypothetical protein